MLGTLALWMYGPLIIQKKIFTYLLIQLDHPQVVVGLECGEEEDEEEHHGNHTATPGHHHNGEDRFW